MGATAALLALTVGTKLVQTGLQSGAIGAQQTGAREAMVQERLKATQASQMRTKQLEQILGAQSTIAASRGISPASGSFKAIQLNSYTNYLKDEQTQQQNLNMQENMLSNRLDQLKLAQFGNLFGGLASVGETFLGQGLTRGGGGLNV